VTRAVLSLGGNLGDRYARLRAAVHGLGGSVVLVSGVYETPPWGDPDQPPYLNAVALVEDHVAARAWLDRARALEVAAGRLRDPQRRYGPRSLDVDLIAVWEADGTAVIMDDPELTLPHPRAHLRAFVLRPWLDLEPYARLPGHGFVHELIRAPDLAADLAAMSPRPELELMPGSQQVQEPVQE
jgi:2-amino-4-hydroxy-6-hydroxymethyldihydropteridine diphosphokinase